jgi:hypothetical protein
MDREHKEIVMNQDQLLASQGRCIHCGVPTDEHGALDPRCPITAQNTRHWLLRVGLTADCFDHSSESENR